ncbi:MAG: hypothetical protein BWY70_01478 [Bacteroidetes bacterium ADurb.Bin408]|nr:MAG: hypothetical protein BWY70_01478 [Bacteroidetes bacterium ADurb.Bin408]
MIGQLKVLGNFNFLLNFCYGLFDHFSIVYMDMPCYRVFIGKDFRYFIEKGAHSFVFITDGRYYRNAEQLTQCFKIQVVFLLEQLIVHVQSYHHFYIHVDKLCGKVQVPLEVGSVNHINHHIGVVFSNVISHKDFFGRVCRDRIRAG